MKRREFLKTVSAGAALAGLPTAMSHAGPAGAVAARSYGMSPYAFAKYTARINKRLTPEMLVRHLGFGQAQARRMIRRLTIEQVLAAPDASGVSRTRGAYLERVQKRRAALRRMIAEARSRATELSNTDQSAPAETGTQEPGEGAAQRSPSRAMDVARSKIS